MHVVLAVGDSLINHLMQVIWGPFHKAGSTTSESNPKRWVDRGNGFTGVKGGLYFLGVWTQ